VAMTTPLCEVCGGSLMLSGSELPDTGSLHVASRPPTLPWCCADVNVTPPVLVVLA